MSEQTKTNEPVKQEGDFKLKSKKTKPKNLGNLNATDVIKVDLTKPEATGEIAPELIKVVVPKEELKPIDDAIQIGETKEVVVGEQAGDSAEMDKQIPESSETIEELSPIQEITKEEVKEIKQEVAEAKRDRQVLGKPLPENIEKLVTFMEDTGGNVEDYVALNKDYSKLSSGQLLKEYYIKTKPHLELEEIAFLMEDNFDFDEDVDEAREIRKKKLAYKEEVAKAKNFLEDLKGKYYEEIKLRPGVSKDQKEATDFFNRYNENQGVIKAKHDRFINKSKELLTNDFKGFDFNVGDKKFRYNVKDPVAVADKQSDISNFIGKFLNKEGELVKHKEYHKALYTAQNADTMAQHFYEQGKTDAIKDQIAKSKNINTEPRKTADGNIFVNGLKVKAISGLDSTKLKIKRKTFN